MAKTALKICGLTRAQDVLFCSRLGVEILGFVTEYPSPSPWDLTIDQTGRLMANAAGSSKTCIVTGGSRDKIISLAKKLHPDYVQLQGHETLADASVIAKMLAPEGIKVIKAIPTEPMERMIQFASTDPARCARLLNDSPVSIIQVNSYAANNPLGNRKPVDPDFFRQIKEASKLPVILAGAVTPENCQEILKTSQPDILDVMTGAEIRPGVKDTDKIQQLFNKLNEH